MRDAAEDERRESAARLDSDVRAVLAEYPEECRPTRVEFLAGAGGFSGALFWRITAPLGELCLRRWPREHPDRERLEFMQAVLWHVHQEGFRLVPLPLETLRSAGYVRRGGHYWELAPWMPGRADYHLAPTTEKLQDAMRALAIFHIAAASFPVEQAEPAPSPSVAPRLALMRDLAGPSLDRLNNALQRVAWPELDRRARRAMQLIPRALAPARTALEACVHIAAPLQPCIRDVWHDHVLFLEGMVSGIIDFGAMKVDNVATDVARLLGSLVGDERDGWSLGLAAYDAVRPLSETEGRLIKALDRSGVVLSLVNWLNWIYLTRRTFEQREAIERRFDELLPRLERLTELA